MKEQTPVYTSHEHANTSSRSSGFGQMLAGELYNAGEALNGAWKGAIVGGLVGAGIHMIMPVRSLERTMIGMAKYGATTGMYIGREKAIENFNLVAESLGYKKVTWVDRLSSYIVIAATLDTVRPIESLVRTEKIATMLLANAITIRGARTVLFGK